MSSPYLWDISGAESWLKIAKGLIKMYQKEVLGRLPVIKHLKFGKLFPYE
jgi:serine/threonine-protein phosphatase 2A activator